VSSESSCAVRLARHSQNAWARHVECVESSRVEPSGIWAILRDTALAAHSSKVRLQAPSSGVAPSYLVDMCQPVSNVSGCNCLYVPQPAVIWLFRELKRQTSDHAVSQSRGQQAVAHYVNRSVTQPRHSDNSNADWKRRCSVWPYGCDLTAHWWL